MFSQNLIPLAIALMASLFMIFLVFIVLNIKNQVPDEDRLYMDPVPFLMKPLWPFLNLLSIPAQFLPISYILWLKERLKRSELIYLFNPGQFFGLQLLSSLLFIFATWFSFSMLKIDSIGYIVLAGILGFFLPLISLNDRRQKRELQIIRSLPIYLDYITMGVQSGLNFSGSLMQATEKGPDGPLKRELMIVQRDIRAGISRVEAMKNMAERLNIREINSLVSTIAQAERTGSDLGESLKIQADQRRIERFQRAEELALKAPVKLVFPLVAFIFPTTFMILLFPIAMKLRDVL
ncbi:type II secretion system F family protein [Candidatus Gracilibacteria bacterium]|nr:type II secretion system F family protein [Candidatus Gracilibacteria bacterium]